MDALRRFILVVFGLVLSVTFSVLVMINGWGLEPKSWTWIIGIGFFGQIMAQIIIAISSSKK